MKNTSKKKRSLNNIKKNRPFKGGVNNGTLYLMAILVIVASLAGVLVGGLVPKVSNLALPTPTPSNSYTCCDSGSGADCHPIIEKQITFNGDAYALLKSGIYLIEKWHMVPAELDGTHGYSKAYTPDGLYTDGPHKIFVNDSDHINDRAGDGYSCAPGKDLLSISGIGCFGIPDEELIYVCKDTRDECEKPADLLSVPFDVYYRVKDGTVPQEIATKCPKPTGGTPENKQEIINLPTPSGTANLQLETFRVRTKPVYRWLGAWCKPADYFYPTENSKIHFDVKPLGEFTYTMPEYPKGGWDFVASPNGSLTYQGKSYPYIYWDAAIPNNLIQEPKDGYSVAFAELPNLLSTLLPTLGLNAKEANDFVAYWSNQLPKSNYYFVGIVPQSQINTLAPLIINPSPDSILRVSLFFKPIDEKITVSAPQISQFTRKGFSVVEWGGIFDTQKHPGFSCLM